MGIFSVCRPSLAFLLVASLIFYAANAAGSGKAVGPKATVVKGASNYTSSTVYYPGTSSVNVGGGSSYGVRPANTSPVAYQGGGIYTPTRGGVIIDSTKSRAPFLGRYKFNPSTVKQAAKTVVRGGAVGVAVTIGLQQLFDGLDWIIEDGTVVKRTAELLPPDPESDQIYWVYSGRPGAYSSAESACRTVGNQLYGSHHTYTVSGSGGVRDCLQGGSKIADVIQFGNTCPSGSEYSSSSGGCEVPSTEPLTESEIDDAIENKYVPHADDYSSLSDHMEPDSLDIDPIPSFQESPTTTTITDSVTGETIIIETNIWHDFSISDNDTVQPSIEIETTTQETTYQDGQVVNNTTTTINNAPSPNPNTGDGPSSDTEITIEIPELELPSACEWFPRLCTWLDWTQEGPGDEPDLSEIRRDLVLEDFEQEYTFTSEAAVCPAPIDVEIAVIGKTVAISWQPFCDLMEYLKYLVMSGAYMLAIYITVGAVRNG